MQKIPSGISREDILDAMSRIGLDPAAWPPKSQSTDYDVIDPRSGARFPPKLVLSVAVEIMTGSPMPRGKFHGGPETNDRLKKLGFDVVPKSPGASS
jgi:5-methylcytosine-specific restriction enzyme B